LNPEREELLRQEVISPPQEGAFILVISLHQQLQAAGITNSMSVSGIN
jgi:hypothetical protein